VKRVLVVGRDRITADAAGGKLDDATRLLGLFKAAGANAGELQHLAGVINAARPKWLEQRAAQNIAAGDLKTAGQLLAEATASGADAASVRSLRNREAAKQLDLQLTAMATQVDDAVRAGALLQPATDNARTRLTAMRSIARNHPITLQAQYEVQLAFVQAGERATRAGQYALAQRDLNAAAEWGSFAPLNEARQQLQQARAAAAHPVPIVAAAASLPQARGSAARAPTDARGTALEPAPRSYIAARPTRALPLRYPSTLDANGTVTVEFTLTAKGTASDVTVVQSNLPELFERAAITAVQHGRYSTRELVNGKPVRARIKLRFTSS
jgi:TonB family protein